MPQIDDLFAPGPIATVNFKLQDINMAPSRTYEVTSLKEGVSMSNIDLLIVGAKPLMPLSPKISPKKGISKKITPSTAVTDHATGLPVPG